MLAIFVVAFVDVGLLIVVFVVVVDVIVVAVLCRLQRGSLLSTHTIIRSFIFLCWQFPPDVLYSDPREPSEVAIK